MINHAFANYSTRVSFNLTLTKTQVFYLWSIAERRFLSVHDERRHAGAPEAPRHDLFVPSARGLIERGLVYRNEKAGSHDWPYELTDAGKHVYELLKIAGIVASAPPQEKAA